MHICICTSHSTYNLKGVTDVIATCDGQEKEKKSFKWADKSILQVKHSRECSTISLPNLKAKFQLDDLFTYHKAKSPSQKWKISIKLTKIVIMTN